MFTRSFYALRSLKHSSVKLSVFFALLGYAHVKAASKILVKLTKGVYFINILQADFAQVDPKSAKKADGLTVFLHFWDLHAQKLLEER
jgi:hypothetical protein